MSLYDAWDPPPVNICFKHTSAFSPTPFNIKEEQSDYRPLLDLDLALDFGQFSTSTVPGDFLTASCQPDRSTDSGEWYRNGISDNEPLAFASPPPSPSSDAASICFGQASVSSAALKNEAFTERNFLSLWPGY
jgi:hypothetical protein